MLARELVLEKTDKLALAILSLYIVLKALHTQRACRSFAVDMASKLLLTSRSSRNMQLTSNYLFQCFFISYASLLIASGML